MAPTLNPLCPAIADVGGRIVRAHVDARFGPSRIARWPRRRDFLELDPHGKTVAVKHRRLNQPQGRHGNRRDQAGQQRRQVPLHALLDQLQRLQRLFAIARQQVEAELRVEDVGLQFLERQHGDGLLLQFVEAALAAFAGRLEDVDDRCVRSGRDARERGASSMAIAMAAGCAIT